MFSARKRQAKVTGERETQHKELLGIGHSTRPRVCDLPGGAINQPALRGLHQNGVHRQSTQSIGKPQTIDRLDQL